MGGPRRGRGRGRAHGARPLPRGAARACAGSAVTPAAVGMRKRVPLLGLVAGTDRDGVRAAVAVAATVWFFGASFGCCTGRRVAVLAARHVREDVRLLRPVRRCLDPRRAQLPWPRSRRRCCWTRATRRSRSPSRGSSTAPLLATVTTIIVDEVVGVCRAQRPLRPADPRRSRGCCCTSPGSRVPLRPERSRVTRSETPRTSASTARFRPSSWRCSSPSCGRACGRRHSSRRRSRSS